MRRATRALRPLPRRAPGGRPCIPPAPVAAGRDSSHADRRPVIGPMAAIVSVIPISNAAACPAPRIPFTISHAGTPTWTRPFATICSVAPSEDRRTPWSCAHRRRSASSRPGRVARRAITAVTALMMASAPARSHASAEAAASADIPVPVTSAMRPSPRNRTAEPCGRSAGIARSAVATSAIPRRQDGTVTHRQPTRSTIAPPISGAKASPSPFDAPHQPSARARCSPTRS